MFVFTLLMFTAFILVHFLFFIMLGNVLPVADGQD